MKKAEQERKYAFSKNELLKCIEELEKKELEELEKIAAEAEKEPHHFSKEFEEWKEAEIRRLEERDREAKETGAEDEISATEIASRPSKLFYIYRLVNTPFKKAAVAVIVIFTITMGFGGHSVAGRFPVIEFFQDRYGGLNELGSAEDFRNSGGKRKTIETVYELGWVPDGYEKKRMDNIEGAVTQVYEIGDKDEEAIYLGQYCVNVYIAVEDEDNNYKETKYKGNRYYYLRGGDGNSVVWYRDGYQFAIISSMEIEEMLEMADKLKEI